MKTTIVTGYAHLASALVNGDLSGLDEDDREKLADFLEYIQDYAQVISTQGDSYFGRPDNFSLKGDVIDYVCEVIE